MALPVITDNDFEREVLRSELPVLIDFFADWCAPCKTVEPEVEAIGARARGQGQGRQGRHRPRRAASPSRCASSAVPTFVVFAKGRPVAAEQGVLKRDQLREMLDPFLPRAEGALRAVELAQAMREGQAVPVDTRDAASYGRARIPGAANIPLEEIETRLAELHMFPGAPILYCRSGDKTKEMADKLAEQGVPVGFLEGGFLAWEAEGLPVERPTEPLRRASLGRAASPRRPP